jgi:hypothetical protein
MIVQPNDERTVEETAEESLWETFKRRLEAQGNTEGAFYLQHLVKAKLEESIERGKYSTHRFSLYQRLSDYSTTYNAVTGEQMSWFFDVLRNDAVPGADAEACLAAAHEVAKPPDDAVLMTSVFETQGGDTVFIARWEHVHDGTPVETDFIQVLVNPRTAKPFAHHRKWHDVDPEPRER